MGQTFSLLFLSTEFCTPVKRMRLGSVRKKLRSTHLPFQRKSALTLKSISICIMLKGSLEYGRLHLELLFKGYVSKNIS